MSKFIIGDEVKFIITDEIRNVQDFAYNFPTDVDKINGVVIETFDESCIVYFKSYGYYEINNNCLDFKFLKNRNKCAKLGVDAFKKQRKQTKIIDYFGVLSDKSDCLFCMINTNYVFVNYKNIPENYRLKSAGRSINMHFFINDDKIYDFNL